MALARRAQWHRALCSPLRMSWKAQMGVAQRRWWRATTTALSPCFLHREQGQIWPEQRSWQRSCGLSEAVEFKVESKFPSTVPSCFTWIFPIILSFGFRSHPFRCRSFTEVGVQMTKLYAELQIACVPDLIPTRLEQAAASIRFSQKAPHIQNICAYASIRPK